MTQIVEILSALFLGKGLRRYIMIQSKRIAELMDIYKQAEKCYKYNQSSSFYRCLEHKLVLATRKYNNEKEILEEYKIACQSYLDSNLLDFNIGMVALMISIVALLDIEVTGVIGGLSLILVLVIGGGIYKHIKRRKLLEISHVLERI
jgi:hypothetical protein